MTEFISRNYGSKSYEIIIKTESKEHYKAAEDFARQLIDHAKPEPPDFAAEDWVRLCNYFGNLLPGVCMEECAELIQAINKMQRFMAAGNKELPVDKFAEELADVIIASNLLRLKWGIDYEKVEEKFIFKMERNIKRARGE